MSNREEKKQERIERYEQYARNAEKQSYEACNRSNSYVAGIPMGQPILVGHHSEKKHRNALEKSWNAMEKSVKLSEKAEYYRDKAKAAANNDAIYTEDDDAEERLTQKIADLERLQEMMKSANKIIRNNKLSQIEKITQLQNVGFSEPKAQELFLPNCFGRIGFESFELRNNNANINRYKYRLTQVQRLKNAESKEYEINGVRVVENTEENRVQLFFDGKPEEEMRKKLKSNGFRWSPSNGCWQGYMSQKRNLRYVFDK